MSKKDKMNEELIKNNRFAKIIFDKSLSNEEKLHAVKKAVSAEPMPEKGGVAQQAKDFLSTMIHADTRIKRERKVAEENAKALREFSAFKDYLLNERKRMADDIIDMTDKNNASSLNEPFNEASADEPEPPQSAPAPQPFEMSDELRQAMSIIRKAAAGSHPAQTHPSATLPGASH
jgi:hypothetical protein